MKVYFSHTQDYVTSHIVKFAKPSIQPKPVYTPMSFMNLVVKLLGLQSVWVPQAARVVMAMNWIRDAFPGTRDPFRVAAEAVGASDARELQGVFAPGSAHAYAAREGTLPDDAMEKLGAALPPGMAARMQRTVGRIEDLAKKISTVELVSDSPMPPWWRDFFDAMLRGGCAIVSSQTLPWRSDVDLGKVLGHASGNSHEFPDLACDGSFRIEADLERETSVPLPAWLTRAAAPGAVVCQSASDISPELATAFGLPALVTLWYFREMPWSTFGAQARSRWLAGERMLFQCGSGAKARHRRTTAEKGGGSPEKGGGGELVEVAPGKWGYRYTGDDDALEYWSNTPGFDPQQGLEVPWMLSRLEKASAALRARMDGSGSREDPQSLFLLNAISNLRGALKLWRLDGIARDSWESLLDMACQDAGMLSPRLRPGSGKLLYPSPYHLKLHDGPTTWYGAGRRRDLSRFDAEDQHLHCACASRSGFKQLLTTSSSCLHRVILHSQAGLVIRLPDPRVNPQPTGNCLTDYMLTHWERFSPVRAYPQQQF